MNLTCSIRNLADQVKHRFQGRRRAASSHECNSTNTSGGIRFRHKSRQYSGSPLRSDLKIAQILAEHRDEAEVSTPCNCHLSRIESLCPCHDIDAGNSTNLYQQRHCHHRSSQHQQQCLQQQPQQQQQNHPNQGNQSQIVRDQSNHTPCLDQTSSEDPNPTRISLHADSMGLVGQSTCHRCDNRNNGTTSVIMGISSNQNLQNPTNCKHHVHSIRTNHDLHPPGGHQITLNESPRDQNNRHQTRLEGISSTTSSRMTNSHSCDQPSLNLEINNPNTLVGQSINGYPQSGTPHTNSTYLIPLVQDLSIATDEHRSNSLGSTYSCFYPYQIRQLSQNIRTGSVSHSTHKKRPDMRRLTMSYSELLSSVVHNPGYSCQLPNQSAVPVTTIGNCSVNHDIYSSINSINCNRKNSLIPDSNVTASSSVAHSMNSSLIQGVWQPSYSSSTHSHRREPVAFPVGAATINAESEPPILPARTSSLNKATEKRTKRSNKIQIIASTMSNSSSVDASQSLPNNCSLESGVGVELQVPQTVHTRSRSDLTCRNNKCYVNTSDQVVLIKAEAARTSNSSTSSELQHNDNYSTVRSSCSNLGIIPNYMTITKHGRNTVIRGSNSQYLLSQASHDLNFESTSENLGEFPNSASLISDQSKLEQCIKSSLVDDRLNIQNTCESLGQIIPTNHASRLLGRMSDKLRDGKLADVVLLAGHESRKQQQQQQIISNMGHSKNDSKHLDNCSGSNNTEIDKVIEPIIRIPAHRVILAAASDYFAAMFGNELKEATEQEIWIHEVEPHALETLINYIYTGCLDLREETVEDLLSAACFLQMNEASQTCERFLAKRLDASNCLGMSRLGERYGCRLLRKKATKFVLEHFTEVVQQPDFLNLSLKELINLISSDHLKIPNEATVFAACLRWMRNWKSTNLDLNELGSKSLLSYLLQQIRLHQLPPRLLINALEKEPLFRTDLDAIHIVISALRYHLSPDPISMEHNICSARDNRSQDQSSRIISPKSYSLDSDDRDIDLTSSVPLFELNTKPICHSKPRPSTIGKLWALGGKTMTTTRALQEILEYDPYWNSWRVIGQLPGQRQQCGCTVLNDGRLLVVGGRDELKTLSTVECICIEEMSKMSDLGLDDKISGESTGRLKNMTNRMIASTHETIRNTSIRDQQMETSQLQNRLQLQEQDTEYDAGWRVVSAMATHRHGLGVAVLEGVVYAVGGHDGWSYLNTVERWNGKAKAWSPVTPMAVQRSTVGVAALDGLLYAVGGRDGSACLRTVERFNPHTQHWCFIAPMLHRRGGVGVGSACGRLYAVGGHNAPPNQPNALRTASVEMYEPRTDMWTEVACLCSPRDSIAVATLGTKLYALGGHDGQAYTNRVQVYDPEENKWSEAAPLPSGRAGIAVASSFTGSAINYSNARLVYHKVDPLI